MFCFGSFYSESLMILFCDHWDTSPLVKINLLKNAAALIHQGSKYSSISLYKTAFTWLKVPYSAYVTCWCLTFPVHHCSLPIVCDSSIPSYLYSTRSVQPLNSLSFFPLPFWLYSLEWANTTCANFRGFCAVLIFWFYVVWNGVVLILFL